MLSVKKEVYERMVAHAKEAYPHECCGLLLGSFSAQGKRVDDAKPVENTNKDRASDRYEINPGDILKIEKEAKKAGMSVVGFYHSHPDHPDRPSQFDRDRGWPEYSYLIIAVQKGIDITSRSWSFSEDNEPFKEEDFSIL